MPSHPPALSLSALLPLLLVAALLSLYLLAAVRQRRERRCWSLWRMASFASGASLLALALSPPLAAFAHHDLRGHMLQHLLLGMFAPLGLILGAPLALALRTLPRGAARSLARALGSTPFHFLSHPFTALILNSGGMALLYLTPLYAHTLNNAVLHYALQLHFLAAGALFTWAIAGPDPAPRRPNLRTRLVALFLAIAAHATLAKLMYIQLWPAGAPHSPAQIRAAAQLMYYGGDLAELLLAVALFAAWYRHEQRLSSNRRGTVVVEPPSPVQS